jgi:2-dehydro-3-deoxyphosphooctonate aldolase (KDO 8-P synthase)
MNLTKEVVVGPIKIGGKNPLALIAGPCVIEGLEHAMGVAEQLKEITAKSGIPLIFKASYDKANRTSIHSFRGPGLVKGLEVLHTIKEKLKIPVLSDVHETGQVASAKEVLDVIQIPAFLCRQTDLILAVAESGQVVNVKKGQFLAPWDVEHIVKKIESTGNQKILLTERGTSFGYNNLVVDMKSIPIMQRFGYPVIFDATHSLQLPGGAGASTGGAREFIPYLARAAAAVGCEAFFMEVHPEPIKALSDAATAFKLAELPELLRLIIEIHKLVRSFQ